MIYVLVTLLLVTQIAICKGGDDGSIAKDFKGFTTYTIDLKTEIDYVSILDYIDTSFCEAIVLESKDDFWIGEIQNIAYRGDTIIIVDSQAKSIFLFDKNGKAVSKIHRVGRARGEYADIRASYISDNKVYIYDSHQSRVVCYDFCGNLVSAFDCQNVYSMAEYRDTIFVDKWWVGARTQGNFVDLLASDGSLIKNEIHKEISGSELPFIHSRTFKYLIAYPGNLSYWVDYDDMVFKYKKGTFVPSYKLEYANKIKVPRSEINKGATQYLSNSKYANGYVWHTNSILETTNYIFVHFDVMSKSNPESFWFIVDKTTGKTLLTKKLSDGDLFGFSGIQDGDYFITYLNGSSVQFVRRVCKDADAKARYVHLTTTEFLKLTEGIVETDNGILVRKKVK